MNVLITGASSGIGRAVAAYLAERGFRVVGTTRNPSGLERAAMVPGIEYAALDVTDPESVRACVKRAVEVLGGIDVLINNAGISHVGPFEETPEDVARAVMETNIFGAAAMIRAALPVMRGQGRGLIINIGSLAGLMGIPFQSWYVAGKYALEGLTESLRLELCGQNIDVVLLEPGNIRTEISENRHRAEGVGPHYRAAFEPAARVIETSVDEAEPPEVIARLVHRIINMKKPGVRYPGGKGAGTIARLVKYLPSFLVEKILFRYYGLPRR